MLLARSFIKTGAIHMYIHTYLDKPAIFPSLITSGDMDYKRERNGHS